MMAVLAMTVNDVGCGLDLLDEAAELAGAHRLAVEGPRHSYVTKNAECLEITA